MTQPNLSRQACAFCSADLAAGRSKEHVLPRWLLDERGLSTTSVTPTHTTPAGEVKSTRRHTLENLQEGRVCSRCNNGWMSDLEADVMPVLRPLMNADLEVTDVPHDKRNLLARWSAKTAFMLNAASNFDQHVPHDHYQHLRLNPHDLPPGTAVFAQLHDGETPFSWRQGAVWKIEGHDLSRVADLTKSTYKVSLLLGRVMLLVAWWPHPGWRMTMWRGIHVPMWPLRGPAAFYEADGFPWNDGERALDAFHSGLWLKQESA